MVSLLFLCARTPKENMLAGELYFLKNLKFIVTKYDLCALIFEKEKYETKEVFCSGKRGGKMENPDFNEIYHLYFQDVFKFLLALCRDEELAEELTQETFFSALKNYESFRGDCKITSWLFQIAKNSLFLHQKRRKRNANRNVDIESVTDEIADANTIEIMFEQKEQVFLIHQLLHDLPEPYKEVFSLRILGELPYSDIAKLFGRTEEWARVTFYRAKLKICEQLKNEEENDG